MDLTHFCICCLDVLHVQLVPFFAQLEHILLPTRVVLMRAIQLHLVRIENVVDVAEPLLAVEHVYCRIVRYRVCCTIDELLLVLHLFENHGSNVLLLVRFCFSARYF